MGAKRVALAIGSNLGDRLGNVLAALKALAADRVKVLQLSRLYESAAAYITDQPPFLNAAVTIETDLAPLELLTKVKEIEARLGRNIVSGQRWGPRQIDLDIIFYEDDEVRVGDTLVIPHPRWQERHFVIAPLSDLCSNDNYSISSAQNHALDKRLAVARQLWLSRGGERLLGTSALHCVMPMGRLGLWPWQGRVQVMGILNITPDSFSDGGRHNKSIQDAVNHARRMVSEGADIIDIGGQSTRPGSSMLTAKEESERIIPVIQAIMEDNRIANIPLSVDTFYAQVAQKAVESGATMINDISGGTLDPEMLDTVASLGVPYVLMHMRGTPQTMQQRENTKYVDVCMDVSQSLQERSEAAIVAGIEPWRLVLDPGLGFAKSVQGNLQLMAQLGKFKNLLRPPLRYLPLLVGPSRKGFLGQVTGKKAAEERDWATAAAAAICVYNGASIIRTHNVAGISDAVKVAYSVRRENE